TCRRWCRRSRACRWASVRRVISCVEAKVVSQEGKKAGNAWSGNVPGNRVLCWRTRFPNEASGVSLARNTSMDWLMIEATDTTYTSREAVHTFDMDCRACTL